MSEEEFDKKNRKRFRVDMSEVDYTYLVISLIPAYFLLKSAFLKKLLCH